MTFRFCQLCARRDGVGPPAINPLYLAACQFVHDLFYCLMERSREIEILFRRLRLYDQLGRRAEELIRTIQRELKERYGLDHVRSQIEFMRIQVGRQREEILQLQRAGISTASAELLLTRMLTKIDDLCAVRDRLKKRRAVRRKCAYLAGGVGDGAAMVR